MSSMNFKQIINVNSDSVTYVKTRAENKSFDQIIKVPTLTDADSTTNFVNVTKFTFDSDQRKEGLSLLDVEGNIDFMVSFCVDSEAAIQANSRYATFSVFTFDPQKYTNEVSKENTSQDNASSWNSKFLQAKTGQIPSEEITTNSQTLSSQTHDSLSDLSVLNFQVEFGITDQMITNYDEWRKQQNTGVPIPFLSAAPVPTQLWATHITSKINVGNTAVKASSTLFDNSSNTTTLQAKTNSTKNPLSSPAESRLDALVQGYNPTSYLNAFYSAGPTAAQGSSTTPIQYSYHGSNINEVNEVFDASVSAPQSYNTLPISQNSLTQQSTNYSGIPSLEDLYAGAYTSLQTYAGAVEEITFESQLLEFNYHFSTLFSQISPRKETLWLRVRLHNGLGDATHEYYTKVNLKNLISPFLIPSSPPLIKIGSMSSTQTELSLAQSDPIAEKIAIYRMIAKPENLNESAWEHVDTISLATGYMGSKESVTYIDNPQGVYSPNVIIYEARSIGPRGAVCPVASTDVKSGLVIPAVAPFEGKGKRGLCTIVPTLAGTQRGVKIIVNQVPEGVVAVALKKEKVSGSRRELDWRLHPYIDTVEGDEQYKFDYSRRKGPITFIDKNVQNKEVYRYYAVFWWKKKEKSLSSTDEYIQYRDPPPTPIVSYMSNFSISNTPGVEPTVSFEFGATLSDTGIDLINSALGSTGVSQIFTQELKNDRSLLDSLLLVQITRKNLRTGNTVTWPYMPSGRFIDNATNRRDAIGAANDGPLIAGTDYQYKARVMMVDPESFFRTAFKKIPASTQQIITNADANFIDVAANSFSANFALPDGSMQSPTTLSKDPATGEIISAGFTGIEHTSMASLPLVYPTLSLVTAKRSTESSPANIISWSIEGNKRLVYAFKLDVVINGTTVQPLCSVSPTHAVGNMYYFRDEIFVHEIVPISYRVTIIYVDQTESESGTTQVIEKGSSASVSTLNSALQSQKVYAPEIDISMYPPGSPEYNKELLKSANTNLKGGSAISISHNKSPSEISSTSSTNNLSSDEMHELLLKNNPKRLIKEEG